MNCKPSLLVFLLLCACSQKNPATNEAQTGAPSSEAATQSAALDHTPIPLESANLKHLLDLGSGIYSGSMPPSAAAFEELAAMGIKTVVNVDSANPAVEWAAAAGLNYVHIPIGYDGIPEEAALSFERVMRESPRPIYFHCHHGKHRGPAAAAIALRAATQCSSEAAIAVLSAAGTSEAYQGLWRDVAAWKPAADGIVLPELVSVAIVADFPAGMAKIDRVWDRLKLVRAADWKTPLDHPDLVPAQEAIQLAQLLHDCSIMLSAEHQQDREFQRQLEESFEFADALSKALSAGAEDKLEGHYRDLATSCKNCHRDYRND